MAKEPNLIGGAAPTGAATPPTSGNRKRRTFGPKKVRPFHAAIRAVDEAGNPVAGAKLEVGVISKSLEEVVDFIDSNAGYIRQRINLPEAKDKAKGDTTNA